MRPPLEVGVAAEPARALEEWRRAERLLRLLPPEDPDRAAVEARVDEMRTLYQELSRRSDRSADRIRAAERSIATTKALLDRIWSALPAADGDG
jgi:hypothetical protein